MARPHIEVLHAPDVPATALERGWPAGAELRTLSVDDETGALTGVITLPPGYRRLGGHVVTSYDLFILGGTLRIGSVVRECGYFEHAPARATQEPWTTQGGVEFLLMAHQASPQFVPEPGVAPEATYLQIDTELLRWDLSPIPGPPPGHFIKVLRHSEDTGEALSLFKLPPRYDYPLLEYHDCTQEVFYIDGDMWSGNGGLHRAGSYIWRPPYVTHGPFYTHSGCILLSFTDSPLVDRYAPDPRRTPEENRHEALSGEPQVDYLVQTNKRA